MSLLLVGADAGGRVSGAVTSLRELAEDAAMLGRLGRDLPRYLRRPLSIEEARRRVRLGVEQRERRFLALVDRVVYGYPRSPYRALLRHAGCERGDLHALVAREGLEPALRHLAGLGVYVSFDEFKGRREAVRGSARFAFSERDFDNPLPPYCYVELTGGSRGRPTRVGRSLDAVTDMASSFALALEAHGVASPRAFFWNGAGLSWAFAHLKLGNPIERWLYPIAPLPGLARAAHRYVAVLARLAGARIPPLEYCDVQEPERVVDGLVRARPGERPIVVNSTASSAVRVASAAAAMGRSLAGVTFHTRSEPLTPTRWRAIEESGALVILGDVLHSRVARSNIWSLTAAGADLWLCGPPTLLRGFEAWASRGAAAGRRFHVTSSVDEALRDADVVMALRIQRERMAAGLLPSLREYAARYGLTAARLALARPDALVMHPGPMNEGVEIAADVAASSPIADHRTGDERRGGPHGVALSPRRRRPGAGRHVSMPRALRVSPARRERRRPESLAEEVPRAGLMLNPARLRIKAAPTDAIGDLFGSTFAQLRSLGEEKRTAPVRGRTRMTDLDISRAWLVDPAEGRGASRRHRGPRRNP